MANKSFLDVLEDPELWKDSKMVDLLQERLNKGNYESYCFKHGKISHGEVKICG